MVCIDENTSVFIECKGKLIAQSQLKLKLLFLAYPKINFIITSDKLAKFPKWLMSYFCLVDDLESRFKLFKP